MMWKKGRVTKLITGSDGIVRGAEANQLTPVIVRNPIQRILPLRLKEDEFNLTKDISWPDFFSRHFLLPHTPDTLPSSHQAY